MKIAVVAPSPVPFTLGGAERLAKGLVDAINLLTPHDAELIKLPLREHNLADLMDSYRAFSRLDLSHFDTVISTKYPSWMVDHPRHVVYMLHPLRGLYDTYPPSWPRVPAPGAAADPVIDRLVAEATGPRRGRHDHLVLLERWDACVATLGRGHPAFEFPGPLARALVHRLDSIGLSTERVSGYFAISEAVIRRPEYFPAGSSPRPLLPPTALDGLRPGGSTGFFTASRLDGPKRVDLLVRAMRHVSVDTTFTIAGTGPRSEDLRALAADDPRITFLGHITDEELVGHYADALAVPFVPLEEDFGYITLEAFLSATPVVTCTDSGGPTELVIDGRTGLVTPPEPALIGAAMERLAADPELARSMGAAGYELAERITWPRVIAQLLGEAHATLGTSGGSARRSRGRARPRIVTLSTYPVVPAEHGGQLRVSHLHGALAAHYDVELISPDLTGTSGTTEPVPGLTQVVVRRTPAFHQYEAALHQAAGMPATDLAMALEWRRIPELVRTIRDATRRADLVLLAQPYLLPALQGIAPDVPFVYDSQNAEYLMKAALVGTSPRADEIVALVEEVERRAVRSAELVIACSDADRIALQLLGPTLADLAVVPNGANVLGTAFTDADERRRGRQRWLQRYESLSGVTGLRHLAIFVASFHPPNLAAAEVIVAAAVEAPEILFVMAGGHAQHFSDWRLPPNVLTRGYVRRSELDRLLAVADVALNPMGSGGGSNLKLAEYFAAGVPVVSSPFGARGFDVVDGEHLVLTEDGDLIEALRRTLGDAQSAARAQRARRLAEDRYDWTVLAGQFVATIDHVLGEHARP